MKLTMLIKLEAFLYFQARRRVMKIQTCLTEASHGDPSKPSLYGFEKTKLCSTRMQNT